MFHIYHSPFDLYFAEMRILTWGSFGVMAIAVELDAHFFCGKCKVDTKPPAWYGPIFAHHSSREQPIQFFAQPVSVRGEGGGRLPTLSIFFPGAGHSVLRHDARTNIRRQVVQRDASHKISCLVCRRIPQDTAGY